MLLLEHSAGTKIENSICDVPLVHI